MSQFLNTYVESLTAPIITGVPTIAGTPTVGQTLTATPAPYTGTEPVTVTYQWRRNGTPIQDADGTQYVLAVEDDPAVITVAQSCTNAAGTVTAVSDGVGVGVATLQTVNVFTGEHKGPSGTVRSFSVPVPAEMVGDYTMVLGGGGNRKLTNLSVNGAPAEQLYISDGGAGGRLTCFRVEVQNVTGTGNFVIDYTLDSADDETQFAIGAVRGGNFRVEDKYEYNTADEVELTFNRANPTENSAMLGIALGNRSLFKNIEGVQDYPYWTTLQIAGNFDSIDDPNFSVVSAWGEGYPGGYYTETVVFNPDAKDDDRVAAAVFVFTPIGAPTAPEELQPSQWSAVDEGSASGDIILVTPLARPYKEGHYPFFYEVELQKTGGTVVEKVLAGADIIHVRRHRGDANATTTCRMRTVFQNDDTGELYRTAWSAPKDVTTTTVAPRMTLTPTLTTAWVGEVVRLDIEPVGFDTLRDPIHEIDFYTTVGLGPEDGVLDAMNSYFNARFGPQQRNICRASAFAFAAKTAGTHTFTTELWDLAGNTATDTVDVTWVDPLTDFLPADIYALSTTETGQDFSGLPVGANTFTDYAAWIAAIKSAEGLAKNALCLIHDDENVGDGATVSLTYNNFMLRRYGGGQDRPKVFMTLLVNAARAAVDGMNFEHPVSDSRSAALDKAIRPRDGIDLQYCTHSSLANTRISNYNVNCYYPAPSREGGIFNSLSEGWMNFGIFGGDTGKFACHGFSSLQWPETIRTSYLGPEGRGKGETIPPVFADHGSARSSRPGKNMVRSASHFRSNNSWGGTDSVQPGDRLFGNGYTTGQPRIHGQTVLFEGGNVGFNRTSRGGGAAANNPQNICFDGFVMDCTTNNAFLMGLGMGGTTIKNALFVSPDQVVESVGSGLRAAIELRPNYGTRFEKNDNTGNPVRVLNCTFAAMVDQSHTSSAGFQLTQKEGGTPDFQDLVIENCVTYAPNLVNPDNSYAPLDTTPIGVSSFYKGRYIYNGTTQLVEHQTQYNTPDSQITPYTVTPQSAQGYQDANQSMVPRRDGKGNLRPAGIASQGWLEPT